jgi:prolyl 4-hydroxylase
MRRQSVREGVFTVAGVLSSDECSELVAYAECHGFEIATINTRHGAEVDRDVRNNDRVILDDQALANQLWVRISSVVPSLLAGGQARGVNERFRFYRYLPGQKFSWHTDGAFERENGERSLLTFMVYLNEGYEGGATEFVSARVVGQTGMGLFFEHQLSHQGAAVTEGVKYVLRSDVMYGPVGRFAG